MPKCGDEEALVELFKFKAGIFVALGILTIRIDPVEPVGAQCRQANCRTAMFDLRRRRVGSGLWLERSGRNLPQCGLYNHAETTKSPVLLPALSATSIKLFQRSSALFVYNIPCVSFLPSAELDQMNGYLTIDE